MSNENPLLTMIREVCALGRAEFERPHSVGGDPDVVRALVHGLRATDPGGEPSDISLSLELLAPRAPYFDDVVVSAIAAGIPQIVNLGAGYDDRAVRFRTAGARFFDLDLPEVVADKGRRLDATGTDTTQLTLTAVDFRTDDLGHLLARAGHDAGRPTLFLAEHLALFLTPGEVTAVFAALSGRAASGSVLSVTAEAHPDGLDSDLVVATADEVMFGGTGPLHTILSREAWLAHFEKNGWQVSHPAEVTKVDHFDMPFADQTVQIQTQFLTASR